VTDVRCRRRTRSVSCVDKNVTESGVSACTIRRRVSSAGAKSRHVWFAGEGGLPVEKTGATLAIGGFILPNQRFFLYATAATAS
jgi:hypothetical protein